MADFIFCKNSELISTIVHKRIPCACHRVVFVTYSPFIGVGDATSHHLDSMFQFGMGVTRESPHVLRYGTLLLSLALLVVDLLLLEYCLLTIIIHSVAVQWLRIVSVAICTCKSFNYDLWFCYKN